LGRYDTVTEPFIKDGWIVHWYGYTPAVGGIAVVNIPVVRSPESAIAVEGNVTLCVALPEAQVQVTIVPPETMMFGGVKEKGESSPRSGFSRNGWTCRYTHERLCRDRSPGGPLAPRNP